RILRQLLIFFAVFCGKIIPKIETNYTIGKDSIATTSMESINAIGSNTVGRAKQSKTEANPKKKNPVNPPSSSSSSMNS
ncbi:hypothetical protein BLOT_006848, partial [Blomia tropicalis]